MNKRLVMVCSAGLLLVILLAAWGYSSFDQNHQRNESVAEYVIGAPGIQGTVDITQWGDHPAYQIGADKDGYAVFKDPDKAFRQMKLDYAAGIKAIRKEFGLRALSLANYGQYGTYGWQISATSDLAALEQARAVTAFMDIFENSFTD